MVPIFPAMFITLINIEDFKGFLKCKVRIRCINNTLRQVFDQSPAASDTPLN